MTYASDALSVEPLKNRTSEGISNQRICWSYRSSRQTNPPRHHRITACSSGEPWKLLSSTARSALQRSHRQPDPWHRKSKDMATRVMSMSLQWDMSYWI